MQTAVVDLAGILQHVSDSSRKDRDLIERAYNRARIAHDGQTRNSGEPYITHCLAVTQILADMGLDATTMAAGLLHDVLEDTDVSLPELEQEFGSQIAQLVDGVTKLKQLPIDVERRNGSKTDREMEYLRKMFLAMGNDFRVILIKLADRLHNMRTLSHMPPHKQIQKSKETLEIFAPIANRLGIWQVKWELEDLAFRYLDSTHYHAIAEQIDERRSDRENYLKRTITYIQDQFAREGLKADIEGRPKHIYSIHRKMERKICPSARSMTSALSALSSTRSRSVIRRSA